MDCLVDGKEGIRLTAVITDLSAYRVYWNECREQRNDIFIISKLTMTYKAKNCNTEKMNTKYNII